MILETMWPPGVLPQEAGVQKKFRPTAVTIFMSLIMAGRERGPLPLHDQLRLPAECII